MVSLMMSRWPQGRRIGIDRSRVAAFGQVLDGMKFGNHERAEGGSSATTRSARGREPDTTDLNAKG
jgi:hypothetical protein